MALPKIRNRIGCLALFGSVFLLAGLVIGGFAVVNLWHWWDARDWEPVPARILSADLSQHRDSDGATTYQAKAEYQYEWAGQRYTGDRVGFSGGADNVGDFHHDAFRELDSARRTGRPVTIWIDPDDPAESVVYRQMRWGLFSLMMLFPLLFGGVGAGIIVFSIYGGRKAKQEQSKQGAHPDAPWRWREEWQDGVLSTSSKNLMWMIVAFATLWNLISLPVLFFVPEEVLDKGNYLALLGLLFPLVGVGLIVWAVLLWKRWRRFGCTRLVLKTMPAALGGALEAHLELPSALPSDAELDLRLSCVHRRVSGSGKNRSTHEDYLWQDDLRIELAGARRMPGGHLPVRFRLPADQPQSDWAKARSQIIWRLDVSSDIPGVDYRAQFDLPVFDRGPEYHLDPNDELSREESTDRRESKDHQGTQDTAGDWRRLPLVAELTGSGHRYYFPPARQKPVAAIVTLFALVFSGIGFGMGAASEWIFAVVFGLFGLLMLWAALYLWLYRSELVVRKGELGYRRGWFALGKPRSIFSYQIKSLDLKSGSRSGNRQYYDLSAETLDGKTLKLAHGLAGKRDCQALLRRIKQQLGMD